MNNHNDAASAAEKINLKGLVIGNGIVNETVQSDELYISFLKSHDLIPVNSTPRGRDQADLLARQHIGYDSNYCE